VANEFQKNETAQKLRGGYYTPMDLARYLSEWVSEANPKSILEPSCGDGVFLKALTPLIPRNAKITAIELDQIEAKKASERVCSHSKYTVDITCANFLEWYLNNENIHFVCCSREPSIYSLPISIKRRSEFC